MTVRRIVANVAAKSVSEVGKFYAYLFGLEVVMEHGWIYVRDPAGKLLNVLSHRH